MDGSISFDSNSLQTYSPATNVGIITNTIEHTNIPDLDLAFYKLAHANASAISNTNYPSKKITVSGVIKGSTNADLDSRIDTFKAYFNGSDKNLDVVYSSATRRYIATKNAISIVRQNKALFAKFALEFICTKPFGQSTSNTTALSAAGRTNATYTDAHTFIGTAPIQQPVITYTLTAVTGGTAANVIIGNNSSGQQLTINRTWANGDVLVIDTYNKTVKVNGANVPFTGAFPEFVPGAGSISYSDGFTTRTFTISIVYKAQYL